MRITPDTPRRDLAALSSDSRRSERRRTELQRLANVFTESDVQVKVLFEDAGAFARPAGDDTLHDFEIYIPVEQFDQVETDLPGPVWDRRVQIALLFHEVGHVLYSDFERFEHHCERVLPRYRELFRTIYNAAEDVVVEAQLANEFDLERDFGTLNDTFRQLQIDDHRRYVELFDDTIGGHRSYTVFEALRIGILARGFGREDRFEAILDETEPDHRVHDGRRDVVAELAPALERFVDDMLTTRDGTARVDRSVEFFEQVEEAVAELPTVQTGRIQTEGFRPVEAGNFVFRSPDDADALPSPPEDGDGRPTGTGRSGPTASSGTTSSGDPGDGDPSGQSSNTHRLGSSARSGTNGQVSGVETLLDDDDGTQSPLEREAKELHEIVRSDDTDVSIAGVLEVDEEDGDPHRWERARRQSQQLAADLRGTLRRRRRADVQSRRRTGQVDPQRIVQATQGHDRVFERRVSGDDRDYSCLTVLDRSGSMNDRRMQAAETATAQLVQALYEVGVDVSVLSMWHAVAHLELPFGGDPDRFSDRLTSGYVGGTTPLSDAVAIARERVDSGTGHVPFVVVVTDGEPDDPGSYTEALDRCTFDVYGVYIDGTPGTHAQYFDRIVYADPSDIDTTLRQLARRLFE